MRNRSKVNSSAWGVCVEFITLANWRAKVCLRTRTEQPYCSTTTGLHISAKIMQRQVRSKENPCYEMTRAHGTPRSLHKADVDKDNKTTRKANQTKPKSTPTTTEQKELEKIIEIRQFDMSYDGGVYEVIANTEAKTLPKDRQPRFGNDHRDAMYDTLNTITHATQQQMDLFRRMMYFMTVLLLIVFLTATSSLIMTVMMLMSDNTLSSNQPTLPPGMYVTYRR